MAERKCFKWVLTAAEAKVAMDRLTASNTLSDVVQRLRSARATLALQPALLGLSLDDHKIAIYVHEREREQMILYPGEMFERPINRGSFEHVEKVAETFRPQPTFQPEP